MIAASRINPPAIGKPGRAHRNLDVAIIDSRSGKPPVLQSDNDIGGLASKKRMLLICATVSALAFASPAQAGGGGVAAGIVGGLAVGTILGAAAAQPRVYYPPPPPPVYVEEVAPVYAAPPRCHWAHGEPVWDGYRWVSSRMRVCD